MESSCPPGGTVADFFCGSGTTLAVAQKTGRSWIGCDASADAVALAAMRLGRLDVAVEVERPLPGAGVS